MPAEPADRRTLNDPAARNVAAIAELERAALHERSALDRFTDAVTTAAGSTAFLLGHAVWFAVWIAFNLAPHRAFEPYAFGFLMLVTSLEAIFLTGIVMMSQNRMTRQADKRAHLDLQVNLLAEQELTAMLQMLHALCQRMDVPVKVRDARVEQLLKQTDVHQLAAALDQELDPAAPATRPPAEARVSPQSAEPASDTP